MNGSTEAWSGLRRDLIAKERRRAGAPSAAEAAAELQLLADHDAGRSAVDATGSARLPPPFSISRRGGIELSNASLLHAEDVAAMLGVSKAWVYGEVRAGRIPCVRLGRYVRFRRESIEGWLCEIETGTMS